MTTIIVKVEVPDETYQSIQSLDMHGSDIHDELMSSIEDNLLEWIDDVYLEELTPPGELEKKLFEYIEWIDTCMNRGFIEVGPVLTKATKKLREECREAKKVRLKR
jgi:hypothetical protein